MVSGAVASAVASLGLLVGATDAASLRAARQANPVVPESYIAQIDAVVVDGYSCGEHHAWAAANGHGYGGDVEIQRAFIASNRPSCAYGGPVDSVVAYGHTCASHVWYAYTDNTGPRAQVTDLGSARSFVSRVVPACAYGSGATATVPAPPAPPPASTAAPTPAPAPSPPSGGTARAGINFSVRHQRNPLTVDAAARTLRARFPAVNKAKLFHHDLSELRTLRAHGFDDVVVGIENHELQRLSDPTAGPVAADALVRSVLSPAATSLGMTVAVAVGNEPLRGYGRVPPAVLLGAYDNVRGALSRAGPAVAGIKLVVPLENGVVGTAYPPSAGEFGAEYAETMRQLGDRLARDGGSFVINIYPFFTWRDHVRGVAEGWARAGQLSMGYALGSEQHCDYTGACYSGLLDASLAATRAALTRLNPRFDAAGLPIVIGETGWPTAGHPDATPTNAEVFSRNALALASAQRREMYLFEAFDEGRKADYSGVPFEGHFGLLDEAGSPKFQVSIQ